MNLLALTDLEVVAEHHDVEIMWRSHLWPRGSFLHLKHRVAVDSSGVPRTAILYHCDPNSAQDQRYIFFPEGSSLCLADKLWTETIRYRTGEETLL